MNDKKHKGKSKNKNGIISGGLNMKKVPSKLINLEDMDDIDELDNIVYRAASSSDDSCGDDPDKSDSEVPNDNDINL